MCLRAACPSRCHFNLPSVEAEEETHSKLPPIKVKFEIPYFTVSGMQVRHTAVARCRLCSREAVQTAYTFAVSGAVFGHRPCHMCRGAASGCDAACWQWQQQQQQQQRKHLEQPDQVACISRVMLAVSFARVTFLGVPVLSHRCATSRSLRKVATRRCRGCATSQQQATTRSG